MSYPSFCSSLYSITATGVELESCLCREQSTAHNAVVRRPALLVVLIVLVEQVLVELALVELVLVLVELAVAPAVSCCYAYDSFVGLIGFDVDPALDRLWRPSEVCDLEKITIKYNKTKQKICR